MHLGFQNGMKHLTSILSIVTAITKRISLLVGRLLQGIRIEIFVKEGGISNDKESD